MANAFLILFASLMAAIVVRCYVYWLKHVKRMELRRRGKNFRVKAFDPDTELQLTAVTTFGFALIAVFPILQIAAVGALLGHLFQQFVNPVKIREQK